MRPVGARTGPPRAPTFGRSRDDEGAVTAELAVAFAAVGFIVAVGIGAVGAAVAQLQCVDAARAAARVAARGESAAAVEAVARARAPGDPAVLLSHDATTVRVTVTRRVHLIPPLPAIVVTASSVAAREGVG